MSRPAYLPAAAALLSLLAGFASARIEAPLYAVTGVTLSGPPSIPNGQSRHYTLQVTTERIDRAASAPARPAALTLNDRLRPALHAGAARLAATELDLARLRREPALQLTLTCRDNELRGAEGGSGLGARAGSSGAMGLPWWDKPATLRAQVDGRTSNALTVLCDGG